MIKFITNITAIFLMVLLLLNCKSKTVSSPDDLSQHVDKKIENTIWENLSSSQRRGKYFFDKYCVVCHGKSGEGDGFNSYNLIPKPKDLSDSLYGVGNSDSFLRQIITLGGRGVNRSSHMPAYQYTLEEEEIQYVIDYLRTLSSVQK